MTYSVIPLEDKVPTTHNSSNRNIVCTGIWCKRKSLFCGSWSWMPSSWPRFVRTSWTPSTPQICRYVLVVGVWWNLRNLIRYLSLFRSLRVKTQVTVSKKLVNIFIVRTRLSFRCFVFGFTCVFVSSVTTDFLNNDFFNCFFFTKPFSIWFVAVASGNGAGHSLGHPVHARRGDGHSGERSVRRSYPVPDVQPMALLWRQTLPQHTRKDWVRQVSPGGNI